MNISFTHNDPHTSQCDLWVLIEKEPWSATFKNIDASLKKYLSERITHTRYKPKGGKTLLLTGNGQQPWSNLLVIGYEYQLQPWQHKDDALSAFSINRLAGVIVKQAKKLNATQIRISFNELTNLQTQYFIRAIQLASYQFGKYKKDSHAWTIHHLQFHSKTPISTQSATLKSVNILAKETNYARDLVNMSPNDLHPQKFVTMITKEARQLGIQCTVYKKKDLEKLKYNLTLAVGSAGSSQPTLIHCHINNNNKSKPIVLVGKGVTFDAGGYSLKPSKSLRHMKSDMAGAATVWCTIRAMKQLNKKINLHVLIPIVENMISEKAYRVDDIITSNRKSVEITNTDAEGRLILADALMHAKKLKPRTIIDCATLTGACVTALGPHTAGLFTNHKQLSMDLQHAAAKAGEQLWQMPLDEGMKKYLETPIADIRNTSTIAAGGAITAACFLDFFVDDVAWAHIDLAGPAYLENTWEHLSMGGTGFGVATLVEYLNEQKMK